MDKIVSYRERRRKRERKGETKTELERERDREREMQVWKWPIQLGSDTFSSRSGFKKYKVQIDIKIYLDAAKIK